MKILRALADNRRAGSPADKMRRRRFVIFSDLLAGLPRPVKILDVGGTQSFWERMGPAEGIEVVLLNLQAPVATLPGFSGVAGDARDMRGFNDGEFDVVFSNSVIEHVGDYGDQRRMAGEVRRVGQRYFVQTPNKYFPVEPHFLFPFYQFLPLRARAWLIGRFDLGWRKRAPDPQKALEQARSVRLLTRSELAGLFPDGTILDEKLLGLTKSFMVFGGFSAGG
jgi:hypothetical protein